MKKEDLRNLFPWPDDAPLPKVRFGETMKTGHLPAPGLRFDTAPPGQRFDLDWEDDKLGLRIRIRQRDSGEIWALVDSTDTERADQVVSVALVGPLEGQIKRLQIKLDKVKEASRFGSATFGTVEQLRQELGSPLTVVACRLEYPSSQS